MAKPTGYCAKSAAPAGSRTICARTSAWATLNRVRTIEASSDLVNWTVLTTVTGQGETPVTHLDTDAPGRNHRFYRMK